MTEGFKEIVQGYLDGGGCPRRMADEFQAAVTTVSRWASGIANPHPLMCNLIIKWISEEAGK